MSAAVNFAFANRQMIAHRSGTFARVLGSAKGMDQVYDVCHNVAKVEEHDVGGRPKRLVVHRKGARRAPFGPGRPEVPAVHRGPANPSSSPAAGGYTASFVLAARKTLRGAELRIDRPRRRTGHVAARGPAEVPRREDP